MSTFMDDARAEAEKRISAMTPNVGLTDVIRGWWPAGFEKGALWAASREPSEAEVLAYLAAFSDDLPENTEWTPDTVARVKRGLAAARAVRTETES